MSCATTAPAQPCGRGTGDREDLAIALDQVEGNEDGIMRGLAPAQFFELGCPSGPTATGSPSIVKLLTLIRSAANDGRWQAKRTSLADRLTVEAKALADLKIEKAKIDAKRRPA